MFDYVGSKIKRLAVIICWIGIIGSLILGFMSISSGMKLNENYSSDGAGTLLIILGVLIMIVGSIASWAGSLMTYGFGVLIENSNNINGKLSDIEKKLGTVNSQLSTPISTQPSAANSTATSSNDTNYSSAVKYSDTSSNLSSEDKELLIKVLSECEDAKSMLEAVKGEFPSYGKVISAIKLFANDETKYNNNYKNQALSAVKNLLG